MQCTHAAQVKAGRELLESEEKRRASELRNRVNATAHGGGINSRFSGSAHSSLMSSTPAGRTARTVGFAMRSH